mgnify:CR=1 FL=1
MIIFKLFLIVISLVITSQNEEKKQAVCQDIEKLLSQHFSKVNIELSKDNIQQTTAPIGDTPSLIDNVKNNSHACLNNYEISCLIGVLIRPSH